MHVVVSYGMGNPSSIKNMLNHIGIDSVISSDVNVIKQATAIYLPGVGSFDHAIKRLTDLKIKEVLGEKVLVEKTPFMGICLGMQLIFDQSEEGSTKGFGWVKGSVKKFNFNTTESNRKLKIPHMGWNIISPKSNSGLFDGMEEEIRYYFVHSYYVHCANREQVIATCKYGVEFDCAVQSDNIFAVQFHPEKSHKYGMQLFKNFIERNSLC